MKSAFENIYLNTEIVLLFSFFRHLKFRDPRLKVHSTKENSLVDAVDDAVDALCDGFVFSRNFSHFLLGMTYWKLIIPDRICF